MRCSTSIIVLLASGISLSVRAGPVQVASESGVDADVDAGKSLRTTPYTEFSLPSAGLPPDDIRRAYPELLVNSAVSGLTLPIPFVLSYTGAQVGESTFYAYPYIGYMPLDIWSTYPDAYDFNNATMPIITQLTGKRISLTRMCVLSQRSAGVGGVTLRLRISNQTYKYDATPANVPLVMVIGAGTRNSSGVTNTTSTPDLSGGGENAGNCVALDDGTGTVVMGRSQSIVLSALGTDSGTGVFTINGFIF